MQSITFLSTFPLLNNVIQPTFDGMHAYVRRSGAF